MASHFLQLNDRISQGEGAPANGDALCTSTSLFPIGAIYIDNNTGILYARNTANGNAADWVSQSAGTPGIDDVLAEAQTLTAARVVDLNGNTLQVKSGGNDFLSIDPTAGAEGAMLRAYNTTDDDNIATFLAETQNTQASITIIANFNSVKAALILGQADVTVATLEYQADTHTFTGQAVFNGVQEFADNAAAITGGLATGAIYRTGDVLKIVH